MNTNRASTFLTRARNLFRLDADTKKVVELWPPLVLFLVLTAVAAGQFSAHDLIVLAAYGYLVCIVSLLLSRRWGIALGRLFLVGMLIRVAMVCILDAFPPASPAGASRFVPGVIIEDEAYYLDAARRLGESWASLRSGLVADRYQRVAAYFGAAALIGGPEPLWGRLLNSLTGCLAAVVIYDAVQRVVKPRVRPWVWWFLALCPTLVIWSVMYLKEALLVLGVGLLLNAAVRIYTGGRLRSILAILAFGGPICLWVREAVILPMLPAFGASLLLRGKGQLKSSGAFWWMFSGLALVLLLFFLSPLGVFDWLPEQLMGTASSLADMSAQLQSQINVSEVSFPFFSWVLRLSGPLRILGFGFLLAFSPTITTVWGLLPILGNPSWLVFAVSAYAITWWALVPLWLRSVSDALAKRDTWWLAWGGSFVIWFLAAGYVRFGINYDAFRFRDAMLPVILLLAAKGLENTLPEWGRRTFWSVAIKVYLVGVYVIVLLRGVGVF